MERFEVRNGNVTLSVIADGPHDPAGLPILCVHGWPELSHSWRYQIAHFARLGRRIAALDVRGYGESDKPAEIAAYTMAELCGDVAAVIDALGGRAILFGHDWGAPIVWNTALRHADKVAAVAGLSVPYIPAGDVNFLEAMRRVHAGRFFYQLYFQEPGVAEAEFSDDPLTLDKIFWGISGEGLRVQAYAPKGPEDRFLTGMAAPEHYPAWMGEADMETYRKAFARGGWHGPLNRYRAQDLDFATREAVKGRHIEQPACFIAGTLDPVRGFVPGHDSFAAAGAACDDFRGTTLIEGAGHWVQQEAPAEVNAALERFVAGL
ncbi:alpha/beta hydrolase [Sphingomonas sp.]|jgi:pimeloyl-ACP methyl ester carboxylesterase|uniref:alpha/beta fold hydrolase n=1 Tax=Sphingomonas sp. TaxID=28214 RepID=UPI002D7FDAB3|nr:alpha/beta hydrolase [Sphingomonas sp.]HEU0043863.1 alpha/beta hydrolase [Sphingomonas sp.]